MYVHVYTSDGYCNAGSLATEGQHQNKRVLAESSAIGQTTPPPHGSKRRIVSIVSFSLQVIVIPIS